MNMIETIKIMLDALENHTGIKHPQQIHYRDRAIEAGRQAIADAEKQEPKCVVIVEVFGKDWRLEYMSLPVGRHKLYTQQYLYTHPQPKREWVGLTDDEINEGLLRFDYALQTAHAWRAGVVFAMTKLKDKNT